MSDINSSNSTYFQHSEEVQDIVSAIPHWMVRWGTIIFAVIFIVITIFSSVIQYPDIINTELQIISFDSPKPVTSKLDVKIIQILVKDDQMVTKGQPLAYLESTANHLSILSLVSHLKTIQDKLFNHNEPIEDNFFIYQNTNNYGEIQGDYQNFYQSYLAYRASAENGFYDKQIRFLQNDLLALKKQQLQLNNQRELQQRDLKLSNEEYDIHKRLVSIKVETAAELREAESRLIAKKNPLFQTDASLLSIGTNYSAKEKEILTLKNQIIEDKDKFMQALNSLISRAEEWKSKYILVAPQSGRLIYSGTLQPNQQLKTGMEVFHISSGKDNFFGEMNIPQYSMGKVKVGQEVLIKLKSYPFEEYGILRGHISQLSDVPYKDGIFISKVSFQIKGNKDLKRQITLKQGMMGSGEIITEKYSVLNRLCHNLIRLVNTR